MTNHENKTNQNQKNIVVLINLHRPFSRLLVALALKGT